MALAAMVQVAVHLIAVPQKIPQKSVTSLRQYRPLPPSLWERYRRPLWERRQCPAMPWWHPEVLPAVWTANSYRTTRHGRAGSLSGSHRVRDPRRLAADMRLIPKNPAAIPKNPAAIPKIPAAIPRIPAAMLRDSGLTGRRISLLNQARYARKAFWQTLMMVRQRQSLESFGDCFCSWKEVSTLPELLHAMQ